MKRFLVPGAQPGTVHLDPARAHHLVHVLRVVPGTSLEVFDGVGTSFAATVTTVDAAGLTLELRNPRTTDALRPVTVVQGLPRGDKLELVIQKATELGAAAVAPVSTERSIVKLTGREEKKLSRWQRIADEAARQCGRAEVPRILEAGPLIETVRSLLPATVVVLDEAENTVPLSQALGPVDSPLVLVIGPEGGLARSEVEALRALGAQPVTLGRLILRTETAALAALAVVRHLDGALG